MSNWQAVVFDLDDTLYPERAYVLSGFRAVADWAAAEVGVGADSAYAEMKAMFDAGIRGDTFNRWLSARGLSAELSARMVGVYRGHTPALAPFPGIPALLDALRPRFRLGLVSDGYLQVQRAKFAALGLEGYFSAVVFSDQLGRESWKPSPAPFVHVLRGLGVLPGAAVYVGDNCAKDFIGARGAGMATIWARYSEGDYAVRPPASQAHAADHVVGSVAELRRLLLDDLSVT